jgi:hypothetical protein
MGVGFDQTYELPARFWRDTNSPIFFLRSFEYGSTGPVTSLKLKANAGLKIVASGSLAGSLLTDPGPVRLVLTTGRMRYCMTFGAPKTFKPAVRYVAMDAAAPADCH